MGKRTIKKTKSKMRRVIDEKQNYPKRTVEQFTLTAMDDFRVLLAYAARNRLGYGKKRLERLEATCNKYVNFWRQDAYGETIDLMRMKTYKLGYNYHEIADRFPDRLKLAMISRYIPAAKQRQIGGKTCLYYADGAVRIIVVYAIVVLDEIRRYYGGMTKAQIMDVLEAMILDSQCLVDNSTGVTMQDIRDVLNEECGYRYGALPGNWHEVAIPEEHRRRKVTAV